MPDASENRGLGFPPGTLVPKSLNVNLPDTVKRMAVDRWMVIVGYKRLLDSEFATYDAFYDQYSEGQRTAVMHLLEHTMKSVERQEVKWYEQYGAPEQ